MKNRCLISIITLFSCVCNAQTIFTSSNLPIIVIDTKGKSIPDEPKLDATMGVIDNGPGKRNNITDPFNGYYGKIGIEIRGQSSTQFPKKQYGIEIRNAAGEDTSVSLLGLPDESDWVLNANYLDKTFMRNVLAYKLFNEMGRYATRTKFCEIVLNGEYIGLYILQEKIKRDKNRVDISKLGPIDIAGDDLTGGYIVRIDKIESGDQYWTSPFAPYSGTNARTRYQYYYPDELDIVAEQKNYIRNYVTRFETVMNNPVVNDPFTNYLQYIDIDSFVDMFLLNEFTKATDAYRISAYFYKDKESKSKEGKLVAGPPWDFDIAFGVANYDQGWDPNGWQALYKNGTSLENPFWCGKLLNESIFRNKLIKRWLELKETIFNPINLDKFIDDTILEINEPVTRNFNKWKILGIYVWPNKNIFKTFAEEIAYLKSWIKQRSFWLSLQLNTSYSSVEWYERDLSDLNFKIGVPRKFHKSYFVKSSRNITSVDLYCLAADVTISSTTDSVSITLQKAGNYLIKGVAWNGSQTISISPDYKINIGTSIDTAELLPTKFRLFQNYPNPFNSSTTIRYQIPVVDAPSSAEVPVTLRLYDVLGREVVTLVDEMKAPGIYKVNFNVGTLNSTSLPSGVYFYRLQCDNYSETKKLILMK